MHSHRHHSWPFGGSSSPVEEMHLAPRQLKAGSSPSPSTSRKRKSTDPRSSGKDIFNRPFTPDLLLCSSSDEEDIFSSAGIIDAKSETRRRRQRRTRREKSKRRRREQRDGQDMVLDNNTTEARGDENIVSSITEANNAPTAKLRRYVWPHLEKARQLLLPIHSFHYLTWGTWSGHSRPAGADDKGRDSNNNTRSPTRLTSSSTPSLPLTVSTTDNSGLLQPTVDNEWLLRPGRRHRRCHSEQPRAWREPSPGLWTLAEE